MTREKPKKHVGEIQPMPVRPLPELLVILERHGSAARAAIDGVINAEEYLRLEAIGTH